MVDSKPDTTKTFSLRETCKQRIKSMIQTVKQQNRDVKGFWLVLDSSTLKMISSFMKNMELLELGTVLSIFSEIIFTACGNQYKQTIFSLWLFFLILIFL